MTADDAKLERGHKVNQGSVYCDLTEKDISKKPFAVNHACPYIRVGIERRTPLTHQCRSWSGFNMVYSAVHPSMVDKLVSIITQLVTSEEDWKCYC